MPAPSQRFATIGVRLIALYFLVYGGAGLIDAALTKARFLWITADLFSDSEDLPASFSENEDEEGEVIGITSRAEQSFAIYPLLGTQGAFVLVAVGGILMWKSQALGGRIDAIAAPEKAAGGGGG